MTTVRAIDGTRVPETIRLPCGNTAIFDVDSGHSYRCTGCMAVWGSVKTPDRCKELADHADQGGRG